MNQTLLLSQVSAGDALQLQPFLITGLINRRLNWKLNWMWLQLRSFALTGAATLTAGRRRRGNKMSAGETCSVMPPPHYSNRQGFEVCQISIDPVEPLKT